MSLLWLWWREQLALIAEPFPQPFRFLINFRLSPLPLLFFCFKKFPGFTSFLFVCFHLLPASNLLLPPSLPLFCFYQGLETGSFCVDFPLRPGVERLVRVRASL